MGKYHNNYIQKSNYLELKTLEYYFGGDTNKAKNVFNIRHKLNSRGFEVYIKYYLKNIGFNMSSYIGGYKADGGIDLKCKKPPLYVQCKKYIKNKDYKGKVSVGEVRNFYGGVVSQYNGNIQNQEIIMLFATTGSFTHYSKGFAKKNDMELFDYRDIGEISEQYTLEKFLKEFKDKGYKVENLLNKDYTQIEINQMSFTFKDLQEDDLLLFLKNIRDNIVETLNIEDDKTGNILKDSTLEQIAKKRILNIGGLKEFHKNCKNEFEQNHIHKYMNELVKGLNILQN